MIILYLPKLRSSLVPRRPKRLQPFADPRLPRSLIDGSIAAMRPMIRAIQAALPRRRSHHHRCPSLGFNGSIRSGTRLQRRRCHQRYRRRRRRQQRRRCPRPYAERRLQRSMISTQPWWLGPYVAKLPGCTSCVVQRRPRRLQPFADPRLPRSLMSTQLWWRAPPVARQPSSRSYAPSASRRWRVDLNPWLRFGLPTKGCEAQPPSRRGCERYAQ